MDVYYAASISTSSRLSPPEEEELRNSVTETPQSLNSTYTDFKKEQRHNEEASSGLLASGIPNTPSNLNMKPTPGRILVTIADKGGKEVTNRGNYVEGQSQIQATATMDDLECGNPIDPAESITTRTKSPKPEIMTLADSTTRGMATTALEPSELFPTNDQDLGLSKPKDTEVPKVESSAVSVISTSPTLTSAPLQQGKGSLPNSHYNMRYQQQSQLQYNSLSLEAESPKMLKFQFDTEHFAIVFHELTIYTEQLESLNDQILEAMTLHQSMNISSEATDATTVTLSTQDSARRPSSPEETRKRMKGKEKAVDLEEERFSMAQLFTDLVMDSWPRIYKIPSEPKTVQVTKDRIKAATKLKDMIVEFWGSQSQFQERAQLVLDVYQV
ncbi:hypothetical protein BGZ49_006004 [Haplosporangium sp. Z 27]|nr:hypothetical protein BGZ49_006004 [Haplosporangium sp. Z 27]